MEDKIVFTRTLSARGDSEGVNIPKELIKFLGIKVGEDLKIIADTGKHGRFIAIYKN